MVEIYVGINYACDCSPNDVSKFIDSYHKLFPSSDMYVGVKKVFFFNNGSYILG